MANLHSAELPRSRFIMQFALDLGSITYTRSTIGQDLTQLNAYLIIITLIFLILSGVLGRSLGNWCFNIPGIVKPSPCQL